MNADDGDGQYPTAKRAAIKTAIILMLLLVPCIVSACVVFDSGFVAVEVLTVIDCGKYSIDY